MSEQKELEPYEVMPIDVYKGAGGHIVLCQEYSTQSKESYLRIMMNPRDAEKVALQILHVAREVRGHE